MEWENFKTFFWIVASILTIILTCVTIYIIVMGFKVGIFIGIFMFCILAIADIGWVFIVLAIFKVLEQIFFKDYE